VTSYFSRSFVFPAVAGFGFTASCIVFSGCGGSSHATPAPTSANAAVPTFTPAAGTYTAAQSVTISDATAGATIYYTTDGSTPTTASPVYSTAIPVAATETIEAVAGGAGLTTSAASSALYTINIPVAMTATPVIAPSGGSFTSSQTVTLADATAGATIYYTLDGSAPTTTSAKYTAPFVVSAAGVTVVNAIAAAPGAPNSAEATATFTLNFSASNQPTYSYTNVQIVGGGFVDGLLFHPKQQGLMYARTDVGGAYRFDTNSGDTQWVPITDFVGRQDQGFDLGVESLALDPNDPTRVYLAMGAYDDSYGHNGYIFASSNKGNTFTSVQLPFKNGSNDNGRFAGERLAVDPNNGKHLYFGSNTAGLYESLDQAASWHAVAAFPAPAATALGNTGGIAGDPGAGVVFEQFLTAGGVTNGNSTTAYVGVSDPTTGLYVTNDGGQSFSAVAGQPTGYYPNQSVFDPSNRYLYISYARQTGCGASCTSIGPGGPNDGQIWRYTLPTSQNTAGTWTNITPPETGNGGYGFSSVAVDAQHPDTLMITTLNKYYPPPYDDVFRSLDDGATWVNYGTNIKRDGSLSPWINFGGATPDGGNWLNHVVVDPFNSDHVMYGDGQTIWQTTNATAVDGVATTPTAVTPGNATDWSIGAVGLEEVVVTGLASPPSGPAHLLSVMYDLGGFTHTTLTASVDMNQNPRLGKGTSVDYAGLAPLNVARVGDSSSGGATANEAFSSDGGVTWTPSATEPAGVTQGDGTVAVSADGAILMWQPGDSGIPANYSTDHGATWHAAFGVPLQNGSVSVAADRMNPEKFYVFNSNTDNAGGAGIYVSTDGGMTFAAGFSQTNQYDSGFFVSPIAEGDIWITSYNGLYHSVDSGQTVTNPYSYGNSVYALGFGAPEPGQTYPAIYAIGQFASDTTCEVSSNGNYPDGFTEASNCIYRSVDEGKTFVRINDFNHQYASAGYIVGDPRVFGRYYLGTPGRGIIQADSPN
jgi:hypothetical protein